MNLQMLNRLSPTGTLEASEAEHRFDLREALSFLWRQWKFIAAVTAVALLIGVVSLLRQTPLYTATSQVLLDRQREKAPGAEAILTDVNLDFAMVESQMAIIRSSMFLRRVVDKEQLVSDPEFGTRRAAPQPASGAGSEPAKADESKPDAASARGATAEQQAVPSDLMYTV